MVKAGGDFNLAGATVRGNGTLFSGDTVSSGNLRANLVINGGTELTLAPHSRGKIFADRAILETGASELYASTKYVVEAGAFRLSLPNGKAFVAYTPETGRVRVTANEGQMAVRNAKGTLIAEVRRGETFDFDPQGGGASSAVEYSGVVRKTGDGKFVLTDDATGGTVELRGDLTDLEKNVNKTVHVRGVVIEGATPSNAASTVVSITSVTPAVTTTGAGLGSGATAALVGGGAAGGTLGGLAAAGVGPFGGDTSN
jgi:hypothetical protein